jgi:signal transduction histidine kinase
VAHDLRAPLRAIAGYAQAVLEDYQKGLDDKGRKMLEQVAENTERMDTLIMDLLDYSRLNTAQLTLEPVPLERVVERSCAMIAAETRGAEIEIVRPMAIVSAHPATLETMLANLISNAVKFVGEGVKPRVRIWSESSRDKARLFVKDNGIGIAEQYHDRIFGVFERLHRPNEYPGTGIGLAIVRKGAERMGGSVGVESAVGQGSTFWVELPLARVQELTADAGGEPQG